MERKLKIAIDCRMILSSGIGRYINELLPAVIQDFESVSLMGTTSELAILKKQFPKITIIDFSAPIYSIKEQLIFLKIPRCDIFWSPHFNIPLFPIRAKKRVVTIHDVFHLANSDKMSYIEKIYAKIFYNSALFLSDKVITVSEFSKGEIIKYTAHKYASKIRVIYPGATNMSRSHTYMGKDENYDKNGTSNYFLYVGNIKPHKNLLGALKSFKLFKEQYPGSIKFKIVGKKEGFVNASYNELRILIDEDPILKEGVDFTGYVTDGALEQIYKNALCLVFPSYYEGFGSPPVEAMILSCPVIASKIASIPEICGDAVLYFNPFDETEICEKMIEIVHSENTRQILIQKGLKRVRKFSWQHSIEEHLALFNCLFQ